MLLPYATVWDGESWHHSGRTFAILYSTAATSAPGLRSPPATSALRLGSGCTVAFVFARGVASTLAHTVRTAAMKRMKMVYGE